MRIRTEQIKNYYLSYGGGVNSTALAIMLCNEQLPQYVPFEIIFADTKTEKDETYSYIDNIFIPFLEKHNKKLLIVSAKEGVLERWERLSVTGSRIIRACTVESKINPINRYISEHGGGDQLIGFDAGEPHRAICRAGKHYPLVEEGIDRESCERIIKVAGLPVPAKSGCWCCPFMRVNDIIELARKYPCRLDRIECLEEAATNRHGGTVRTQWGNNTRPVSYWRQRASQGEIFNDDYDIAMPCECYDG